MLTISAEHNIKESVSMKEREETEGEWECALTIQHFIKMSNTKDYRKKDITSTKSILGRTRLLGVGGKCQWDLIYSNLKHQS